MTKAKKSSTNFCFIGNNPYICTVKQMLNPKSNGNETVDFS